MFNLNVNNRVLAIVIFPNIYMLLQIIRLKVVQFCRDK